MARQRSNKHAAADGMSQLQARKEADSSALAAARNREDEELVEAKKKYV
jgi:hypothetical protein